ncbi:MAG: PilZ domain-containing protein [Pirellulales bacterium]|nr:PilZ domain-containing protein [Pirellulales bacterium]
MASTDQAKRESSAAQAGRTAVESTCGEESRQSSRKGFPYGQMIGPVYDGQMPQPEDFFRVRCHDISPGGLSFYLSGRPQFDQFVVALGQESLPIYFLAEVAHITEAKRNGVVMFRVGCRFLKRATFS